MGDIFETPRPLCLHGMACVVNKKSRKMVQIRIVYFIAVRKPTLAISSRGSNKSLWSNTSIVLFSNPPEYRYKIEETGETFNSTKTNAREALEEHKFLKSVNPLPTELDKIDIF